MRRAPGWSVLAATAIELGALALLDRLTEPQSEHPARSATLAPPARLPEFIAEVADASASYYSASDGTFWMIVGLYADGRARIIDNHGRRLAGTLHDRRAEMVELGSGIASRLVAQFGIDGTLQIEMYGGAYDGRVLRCKSLEL